MGKRRKAPPPRQKQPPRQPLQQQQQRQSQQNSAPEPHAVVFDGSEQASIEEAFLLSCGHAAAFQSAGAQPVPAQSFYIGDEAGDEVDDRDSRRSRGKGRGSSYTGHFVGAERSMEENCVQSLAPTDISRNTVMEACANRFEVAVHTVMEACAKGGGVAEASNDEDGKPAKPASNPKFAEPFPEIELEPSRQDVERTITEARSLWDEALKQAAGERAAEHAEQSADGRVAEAAKSVASFAALQQEIEASPRDEALKQAAGERAAEQAEQSAEGRAAEAAKSVTSFVAQRAASDDEDGEPAKPTSSPMLAEPFPDIELEPSRLGVERAIAEAGDLFSQGEVIDALKWLSKGLWLVESLKAEKAKDVVEAKYVPSILPCFLHSRRAFVYLKLRKWAEAESDCSGALKVHCKHAKASALSCSAAARCELGTTRSALEDLKEALQVLDLNSNKGAVELKEKINEQLELEEKINEQLKRNITKE